jgi:enediyne biosynthesis protein E4
LVKKNDIATMRLLFLYFIPTILFFSCKTSTKEKPLFELAENTGIEFNNIVIDQKLENSFFFRNYYNGGGVAIADINNDSLCDVLLTSNMGENKLYLNKGGFKFEDITAKSGMKQDSMWSTGAVMTDVNSDGWLDVYICNSGHMQNGNRKNKLYINNQNLSFTESASLYGLDISAYTTQVSFFDYDLDGDLDCFMINNSPLPLNSLGLTNRRNLPDAQWPVAGFLKGGGDHLYRNDNNKFKEVTLQAGIHGTLMSFGLGVSVGDINDDGYPDVFVANDSYERDYLYINQKDGTFKDEAESRTGHLSFSSMGADVADINNDGFPELFTTDMLPDDDFRLKTLGAFDNIDFYNSKIKSGLYHQYMKNCLFLNDGDGNFCDIANFSGVSATDWSWGALFFDADNDGYNDIFVCNGINHDVTNLDFMDFFADEINQKMVVSGKKESVDSILKHIPINPVPNKAFRNNGDLSFSDIGQKWGFSQSTFSNGAAYGDLDNDGDLDLILNNENQPAFVYQNKSIEQNKNNYIGVTLRGRGKNTFAIGSKIKVYKGASLYYRELMPSRGFQSSVDYKQIIGVGNNKGIDSIIVVWPDRTSTRYDKPEVNKIHVLQQPENGKTVSKKVETVTPFLRSVAVTMEKHTEDDYIDFYYERNLPIQLSKEGPKIAKADIDGDGLEDVYIGGARDQAGQLYLQGTSGFVKKEVSVFEQYADFEDVAVLFFDADKDGDKDLFVGAGGNNVQANSRELQHRLYINNGKGDFELDSRYFGNNNMNIAVAINYDYDGDGDEDLFVGSRNVPYSYAVTPISYLYENDGKGSFTDVSAKLSKEIQNVGMVTGAVWADVNEDKQKELIITGEWMATRIFSYNKSKKRFEEIEQTNLENLKGWWQTIVAADINSDGKEDLIIGNIGENFYLKPTFEEPVKLWLNDFDNSKTMDQFLTRTVAKKDMPVFLKREITDQFPILKKENLRHSDYARKTIQQLFGDEKVKKSAVKEFNFCSSIVAINMGNGKFEVKPLPKMVQLSSVNAIAVTDVSGDGKPDLVIGGNLFTFPPQFGRLDGSYGEVLINDGRGNYNRLKTKVSGLNLKGEVKDIKEIKGKDGRFILIVQNNQYPILYQIKKVE